MKTAFQLANSEKPFTDRLMDIQEYGRQCAEQALKDAGVNVAKIYKDSGMTNLAAKAKEAVETTPIVTL